MGGGKRGNINMVPTVGSLLRTLANLCVDPIDPKRKVTLRILFNWRYNKNANDDAIHNGNESGGERWLLHL